MKLNRAFYVVTLMVKVCKSCMCKLTAFRVLTLIMPCNKDSVLEVGGI